MIDFLGNILNIGDTVDFIAPRYRSLVRGIISAFTDKNVRIEYINDWNFGKPGLVKNILQSPDQLVKVVVPEEKI